ncbi:MAG: NADH-quinone oxidoreductase subunit C [Acidimicrobiia bacterium]|nr:NADH-quinone oxidoreductase subunit C [Acidimicrobiia bacterium]
MLTAADVRSRLATLDGVTIAEGDSPLTVTVPAAQWATIATRLKDEMGFGFFSFLSAVDWKEEGLEVVAWIDNTDARLSVVLKTRLGAGGTTCPSLAEVYRGANWMERECFDMFGISFEGHPDLRRILLPDDWVGYPLLKLYDVDTPYPPYR